MEIAFEVIVGVVGLMDRLSARTIDAMVIEWPAVVPGGGVQSLALYSGFPGLNTSRAGMASRNSPAHEIRPSLR